MRMVAVTLSFAILAAPWAARADEGWNLVWSEEFAGPQIDLEKWTFDVDCWGGGNDERQCYTKSAQNARIADGKLIISARRERTTGWALPVHLRHRAVLPDRQVTRGFSSARLSTRGKASWRYGKIEISARLPQGQGTWPAIWMLPDKDRYGSWAASGEIDILEAVNLGVTCKSCPGYRENRILGTLHFGGKWPGNKHKGDEMPVPEVLDGKFHTYSILWSPERIIWYVDGRVFARREASEWSTTGSKTVGAPFDQPFHLILNLAIGGKLAESRGLGGVRLDGYPKTLEIDWVRVWQVAGSAGGFKENAATKGGN